MNFRKSIFKFWSIAAAVGIAAACTNVDAEDIDLVKLGALEKEFIVEADANSFDIDIYTNGAYHIERINESDWLSLACGETTDGKATITAECEFNEDFKRKAGIVLCSDVDSRRDTLYIKQKALIDARIAFANSSIIVPGAGGENKSVIETNVPFSDITVETEYSDPENTDWIQEIEIVDAESEERELVITLDANPAEEVPRSAAVSLSFTDGWDETVSVEFNLLQRTAKETLGRNITFEEFRQNYALNKKIEDYVIIEGIVVSNPDNRNAGENTQLTTSTIDYTVSERTLYLESKDGRYGIAILTNEVEDNIFDQYDHVQLLIQGATGNLVENPDRYELEGVTKSMVISRTAGSASDVPVKEKHMNELTDDDIYTYVTLKEVEFPVRKGSITPVNEGYAIGTNAHRISKYPLLVRDINGDAMYMMTNTNCAYRSDGTRLPYGSGDISGVIVHERFSRFEWRNGADPAEMTDDPTLGYIGRYQIRHQNKEDIWGKMQNSVEDSFSALLTEYRYWNPDTENEVQKPHLRHERLADAHLSGKVFWFGLQGVPASHLQAAHGGRRHVRILRTRRQQREQPLRRQLRQQERYRHRNRPLEGELESEDGRLHQPQSRRNDRVVRPVRLRPIRSQRFGRLARKRRNPDELPANQLQRQYVDARQGQRKRQLLHRLLQPLLVGRRHGTVLRMADQLLDRGHFDLAHLDANLRDEHAADLLFAPLLVRRVGAHRLAGARRRLAMESHRRIHGARRLRLVEYALLVDRGLQVHRLRTAAGNPRPPGRLHPSASDERPLQRRQRLCQRPPERKRCRSGFGLPACKQPRVFRDSLQ